jgi:hypothetical protein
VTVAFEVLLFLLGLSLVVTILSAAVRTVVVPRAEHVLLNRAVFVPLHAVFRAAARGRPYDRQDAILARFAPTALLLLPVVWAIGAILGFSAMFWALHVRPYRRALVDAGSSLTTLGFERTDDLPTLLLSIAAAIIGLGLVALLISFLPTMYGHFSKREAAVGKLFVRSGIAGVASPVTLLTRAHQVGGLAQLDELWAEWEGWFIELEESHTSFPALVFFRSPAPNRSWVTAAGVALDGAALTLALVDAPRTPRAQYMIRSGFVALRSVAEYYGVPFDPDPRPDDPVSVTREEFDAVVAQLEAAGVPLVADRDAAWRAYAGWRVNYDACLVGLAGLVIAPPTLWSSDRADRRTVRIRRP